MHNSDNPETLMSGTKVWRDSQGAPHRIDGPAIIYAHTVLNINLEWCLNGYYYKFDDWLKKTPISLEEKVLLKLRYG